MPFNALQKGFTLIELMITVVIIAVIAAIAIPSYQTYTLRAKETQAKNELERLATLLERHKSRNFNYKGFDATQAQTIKNYTISIVDGDNTSIALNNTASNGRSWAMKAVSQNPKNYTLLLTSQGLRCKNKTANNVSFTGCGTNTTGREEW